MGLLKDKFKEVILSILPVIIVVAIIAEFVLCLPIEEFMMFLLCIVLVIIGFTIFLCGVDIGIHPMGNAIGMEIPKRKSRLFMIIVVFAISFLVTIAEPDVTVFASQVHSLFSTINTTALTYAIAVGVGVFLIIAAFKIIYKISLKLILTVSYILVIALALHMYFTGNVEFLGIAFDSGGVTTGPVTVPVLLALGIGICSVGLARNELDGFGMIGLASVGPIIALLIMGIVTKQNDVASVSSSVSILTINFDLLVREFINSTQSVLLALLPLLAFFVFFQKVFLAYSWNAVKNMVEGVAFAGIGIIIFLTGVYTGFIPIATGLGMKLLDYDAWVAIGLGLVLGFLVAFAEPAVSILGDQVEESSDGILKKKHIVLIISSGVALLVGLGMAKLVFDFNFVFIIVPGYIITLVLMWIGDKDMVGIAFDAGGVSTGPMSVAILSSIYVGFASVLYSGTEAVINGFGLIALIALAPCLFLSILGIYTKYQKKRDGEYYGE